MLEIGAVQFFHDPLAVETADIQELSKTHEIVSRSKTELWDHVQTHYLPLYFPEADPPSDANMQRPQERSTAERTLNPAKTRT